MYLLSAEPAGRAYDLSGPVAAAQHRGGPAGRDAEPPAPFVAADGPLLGQAWRNAGLAVPSVGASQPVAGLHALFLAHAGLDEPYAELRGALGGAAGP